MYKKSAKGWLKHLDFVLIDLLCLQIAFLLAFWARHGISNPYINPVYLSEVFAMFVIQLMAASMGENFKNVLKRGLYKEFTATLKQAVLVTLITTFFLFMVQNGNSYSRFTLVMTGVFYCLLSYSARLLWKRWLLAKPISNVARRSLLIITDGERLDDTLEKVVPRNYSALSINGLVLMDEDREGAYCRNIPVVANQDTVIEYVCRNWVDEVFLHLAPGQTPPELLHAFHQMGITCHQYLTELENTEHQKQHINRLGRYTVLTSSMRVVTGKQLLCKRILDIAGGLVGCLMTGVLFLVIAPIIYAKSPGPIFFRQTRVGRNGKVFQMYKFRSMYLDAEERKKDLLKENRISDGLMFKMDNDPRIIKGIGHFIRKHSIDEFPQFFNVLKGDMSLVGTRPPTVDEWDRYSIHHRARLSIKPGITGLWQISGRSEITDFEEVVEMDREYIEKWSIGYDCMILLKTVGVLVGSDGAM